jgi:hypothetical protein
MPRSYTGILLLQHGVGDSETQQGENDNNRKGKITATTTTMKRGQRDMARDGRGRLRGGQE